MTRDMTVHTIEFMGSAQNVSLLVVTVTEKGFRMPRWACVFFFSIVFRYTVSRVSLSSKVPAGMLCRRWFRFLVSHILTP